MIKWLLVDFSQVSVHGIALTLILNCNVTYVGLEREEGKIASNVSFRPKI